MTQKGHACFEAERILCRVEELSSRRACNKPAQSRALESSVVGRYSEGPNRGEQPSRQDSPS